MDKPRSTDVREETHMQSFGRKTGREDTTKKI
jgi:hypothetical protein